VVDNTLGPVTLYVTGWVDVAGTKGEILVADSTPEKFAMYVMGGGLVRIRQHATFHGVVYAPESPLHITSHGAFYGAFVGDMVTFDDQTQVYFDTALLGTSATSSADTTPSSMDATPSSTETTTSTSNGGGRRNNR